MNDFFDENTMQDVRELAVRKLATILAKKQAKAMQSPERPTETTQAPPEPKQSWPTQSPDKQTQPEPQSEAVTARPLSAALDVLARVEGWQGSTGRVYRSLLKRWESFHDGAGPSVEQIDEAMLVEFIDSVKDWAAYATRDKQLTLLTKMLKAVAPKEGRSKFGMRKADAWISEVPYARLPKPERAKTAQAWRMTTISVDDIGRMYEAAGALSDSIRWQTMIVLAWMYGPRRNDLLLMPWDAFDRESATLSYIETKGGHPVGPLPVPDFVTAHINACKTQSSLPSILQYKLSDITGNSIKIYSTLYQLYEAADVEVLKNSGGRRVPFHGLRSACITNWKSHASELQRFVTGHQHGSDTSDRHYARVGDQMREKFNTLPVPDAFRNGPARKSG